jgi:hypothetical protein
LTDSSNNGYFGQTRGSVFVRMALFDALLREQRERSNTWERSRIRSATSSSTNGETADLKVRQSIEEI